jgi:predicted RNA-binding Zn ribbon-like protein
VKLESRLFAGQICGDRACTRDLNAFLINLLDGQIGTVFVLTHETARAVRDARPLLASLHIVQEHDLDIFTA